MEYWEYFRLSGPPFQPASPDGAVYFSPTHLQGLSTLEAGLSGNLNGLTLLTGEAGTGKTTLIYSLLQRDYKRVRIAHIDDPKLSFLEIMRVILAQLNLYSAGSTKLDYLKTLEHLLELHGQDERIAIVIDESQVLSDDVLEELRLLWNRGQRHDRCLLQVILVGQPELAERLKKPELRQLNQRISSRGVLKALSVREGITYVDCKLNAQGGKCDTVFEPRALNHLLRYGDGIPRKINMICHNAMIAGFHSLERKVSLGTAKKVAEDYQKSVGITYRKSLMRRLAMPALALGGVVILLLGVRYQRLWMGWVRNHIVAYGQPEPTLEPLELVEQAQAAKHLNASAHPDVEAAHADFDAKPKAASAVVPQPIASRAPMVLAALAAPKVQVAKPATTSAIPLIGTASAAAAVTAAIQKPARVSAAPPRQSQIAVRSGDTLEKIAVRYFGSTSGIDALVRANPQLTDINQLSVGQIIHLPSGVSPEGSRDQTTTSRPVVNTDRSLE